MSLQLFSERLKDDRVQRGLTQDQMALAIKMSKRSYCAYEAGETSPSAKLLAALTSMGSDIGYLLTGQRTSGVNPTVPALTADEQELLELFRAAPLAVKAAAIGALHGAAAAPGAAKPRAKAQPRSATAKAGGSSVTQTFHGTVQGGVNQTFHGTVQGDVINGMPAAGKTARGRRTAS